jgi:hypothetical protein
MRDERGRELFDVEDGELRTGEEPAPVRFLPDFDNATLSHDDRTRIVPAALPWPQLDGNGARPVVLVDGFVTAVWRIVGRGGAAVLELHPMRRLAPAERAAVEAEASETLAFVEPAADPGALRWFDGRATG